MNQSVHTYPILIKDEKGAMIYYEPVPGRWWKWERVYTNGGQLKRMVISNYYGYYHEVNK